MRHPVCMAHLVVGTQHVSSVFRKLSYPAGQHSPLRPPVVYTISICMFFGHFVWVYAETATFLLLVQHLPSPLFSLTSIFCKNEILATWQCLGDFWPYFHCICAETAIYMLLGKILISPLDSAKPISYTRFIFHRLDYIASYFFIVHTELYVIEFSDCTGAKSAISISSC